MTMDAYSHPGAKWTSGICMTCRAARGFVRTPWLYRAFVDNAVCRRGQTEPTTNSARPVGFYWLPTYVHHTYLLPTSCACGERPGGPLTPYPGKRPEISLS